jgi:hypothetical protein
MWITLADSHKYGKYPTLRLWLTVCVRWTRALPEIFLSTAAEIPSVAGGFGLERLNYRRSSYRLVSWACGWGRRKYVLPMRFTDLPGLAVPNVQLRWRISSKCCDGSSALSAQFKNSRLRSNRGGTDRVGVVKYLATFQNGLVWGCSVPRKGGHSEFHSWETYEVRTRERIWSDMIRYDLIWYIC